MSDYISREAVLLHLNDIWLSATPTDTMYDDDRQLAMVRCMGLNDAMDVVRKAPAADVRPVVFCKDCKNNYNTCLNHGRNEPMCDFTDRKLKEDDFCSRGVKREES